ncbi:MAG: hypothetical protein QME07_06635 [bacterium]|nr:hypothetical protein [bacterium]
MQYEAFIQDEWHSIIRYDTSHGFAHKDLIFPDGRVDKQPLYFESYNLAFTSTTLELKRYWKLYRENYERMMKR